jgi:hypothetical protein
MALQEIDFDMGPTTWLPNSHTAEAHKLFQNDAINLMTKESTKDKLLRT